MKVSLEFEVIGSKYVDMEIDEAELEKPWDEMTEQEKIDYIDENVLEDAEDEASNNSPYDIGELLSIKAENDDETIYL